MKTPILLHIPEPCHENWYAMTPQDKGRHCQSCNKIVVDFSVMTDRQVLDYFSKGEGNTCGRFNDDQLQRPLIESQTKPSKWGYFFATFLGLIMGSKLMAQGEVMLKGKVVGKLMMKPATEVKKLETATITTKVIGDTIYNTITKNVNELLNSKNQLIPKVEEVKCSISLGGVSGYTSKTFESNIIYGFVMDEKYNPISGATIQIQGTKIGIAADSNGSFQLKKLRENNKLTILISSIGFEQKTIDVSTKKISKALNIVLKEKNNELEEVSVSSRFNSLWGRVGGVRCVRCFRHKELAPLIIQKIFNNEFIKIYPNPAPKNSIIHIKIKDAGEYSLQMFDAQSRLVIVKKIITKSNQETTEFQLPSSTTTGIYFIRFINVSTNKQVTEKVIIQ